MPQSHWLRRRCDQSHSPAVLGARAVHRSGGVVVGENDFVRTFTDITACVPEKMAVEAADGRLTYAELDALSSGWPAGWRRWV